LSVDKGYRTFGHIFTNIYIFGLVFILQSIILVIETAPIIWQKSHSRERARSWRN